jgi:Concanavalin A-like lectin/glucanases superfamily
VVAADPTVEDHMDGLSDPDRLLSGVSASSLEKLDVQQIRLNSPCSAGPKSTLRNLSSHSLLRGLEKKGDREPTPEKDKPLPGFSPSNRSKVATIRELLPFLVSFIQHRIVASQQCYEKHGREKDKEKDNERDKDSLEEDFGSSNSGISHNTSQPYLTSDFIWLIKQMRTLSVLLEMTRWTIQKYLQAGEGTVDSLFPLEICDRLQHTLMLHADHMMKTQKKILHDLLQSPDSLLPKSNLDNRRCAKKDTDNNGRDTNRDRNRDRESCVEEIEYSMSSLLSPQPRKELTAWELIQKVQGGDFVSLDVTDNTDSVMNASALPENSVEKKLIRLSMGQLRKELVLNYFSADCNAQGGPRILGIGDETPPFFNAFGSCLSDHFDTLFYTDSLKSEFLVLLGGLLSKDTMDSKVVEKSRVKETEQYCRSLRLFVQILLKYRRMKEVLQVVLKPRRIYGLTVFQQLITVYSHLSMLSLQFENQVQDPRPKGIKIPSRELCRALNVLEQCNSNFVKCVIPLIFAPSSSHSTCSLKVRTSPIPLPIPRPLKSDISGENTRTVENDLLRDTIRVEKEQADEEMMWTLLGKSVIQGIFHSAECVLDHLANEPNEDSINTQRHGAVITSVLPTVLVYGISNSRASGCVQDLLPLTRSLTRSIQSYISGKESDNQSVYKAGNNGVQNLVRTGTAASSSTVAPCVDSKEGSPSCPGTACTSEKIISKSFASIEEKEGSSSSSNTVLTSVKRTPADRDKDLSHLTWWSRLLKLAYLLNAKLAASLLYDPTIHVKDPLHCVSAPKDCYPLCCPLSRHQIWSILTPPEDLIAFMNISASARPSITTGGNSSQKPVSGRSRQPMPLTPNSKESATNGLYIKLLNKCVIMRDRESANDLLYRSIQTALKTSVNMRVLVQGIEHAVFEAVVFVEGTGVLDPPNPVSGVLCGSSNQTQALVQTHARIDRCSKAWTAIARLTKRIMSQRSVLVSESSTLTWLDTLTIILRQTNAVKEVILACNSSIIISPIGMSARVRKFPALRRVILVVVCMLRWNAAVRLNLKSTGCITVRFITSVLESMTHGLTSIPSPELMSTRWKTLLSGLRAGSTDVSDFSKGLMVATEIVQETPFSSVKCDIINSLTAALRNRFLAESNMSVVCDGTKVAALCCTESAWQMRKEAGRALESYLCSVVRDLTVAYLSSSFMSPAEIHYFSLVLSLLQLLFVCGDEDGALEGYNKKNCMRDPRNFKDVCHTRLLTASKTEILKHLEKVFIAIDVRTMQPSAQILEDRASSASRAWGSSRDRSKALKKVSNAIVSLYLAFSCREGSARENGAMCNHVMSSHDELLAHLQKVRQSAQQQMADSELQSAVRNSSVPKPTETLDSNSPSSNSAVPAIKICAHAIKEGSKRRCQELIVRPLEFCRAQEGFVVQGDSLLSNFKGIDFTLATWLYVDKKCTAGHSFITGRVSHHDAWPLMLLRNDNKLDIIYGHNNNFECMASIAVIPLYTWTHVAVVIEQKKIKLFVNGVMDCQVNTKGNSRAIVYPIVVGLCPTGLRTHVDHTRVGFDGLLAQYKYYTRALSPIHVRVVFDQGQSTLLYLHCVCLVMRFLKH